MRFAVGRHHVHRHLPGHQRAGLVQQSGLVHFAGARSAGCPEIKSGSLVPADSPACAFGTPLASCDTVSLHPQNGRQTSEGMPLLILNLLALLAVSQRRRPRFQAGYVARIMRVASLSAWLPVAALASAGCGPSRAAVEGCIIGWWLAPVALACTEACPRQPECGSADCRLESFMGLIAVPSRRDVRGTVSVTRTGRQMSLFSGRTSDVWELQETNHFILMVGNLASNVQCERDQLRLDSVRFVRADASLGAALQLALDQNQWDMVQLQ